MLKMIFRFLFTLILIIANVSISEAYFPIWSEIKDTFDDEVKKTTQHISEGFREEFQKAIDDLFNNKIQPVLKEIDLISQNRIEQADTVIENRLNQIDTIIKESMFEIRSGIADFNVIIQNTSDKIGNLRVSFKKDIDDIFDQIKEFVDCQLEGAAEKTISDIENIKKSFIPKFPFMKDKCYKIVGINAPLNVGNILQSINFKSAKSYRN